MNTNKDLTPTPAVEETQAPSESTSEVVTTPEFIQANPEVTAEAELKVEDVIEIPTAKASLEGLEFPDCQVEVKHFGEPTTVVEFLKVHNSSPITKQSRQSIIDICKAHGGVYGQNAYCVGTEEEVLEFISKLK